MPAIWSPSELRFIIALALVIALASGAVWWARYPRAGARPGCEPARLDLNLASAFELEALPNMTARQAANIVADRKKHGPFRKVEDLLRIDGIRDPDIDLWAPFVRVEDEPGKMGT